jgi:membrane peptidoglycan carboxypeptidase
VTNEDGAFYRHGGFNMEAVRQSIAENAIAGRYRRGAGTITMQLVRNLYLGHERTLSRKWQEVALAWIIEHLTPVTKERLLEIYLNIIEWGPDIHGADEATRFYFGHDASRVSVDEALFLATLVPSPSKWKWRLEQDGTLRAGTRAQMHFIGRRMIDKRWLPPEALPPADSLRVALLGPARDLMLPAIAAVDDPRFEIGAPDASAADSTGFTPPATGDSLESVPRLPN